MFPPSLFADDSDLNTHQIHIHLLEFQLLNRQNFDSGTYGEQWALLNGHGPITSQIVVDPTPYLQGGIINPAPVETGWKDTIQAPSGQVTRNPGGAMGAAGDGDQRSHSGHQPVPHRSHVVP